MAHQAAAQRAAYQIAAQAAQMNIAAVIASTEAFERSQLAQPETRLEIGQGAPNFALLQDLLSRRRDLGSLSWRKYEELIADLLRETATRSSWGAGPRMGGVTSSPLRTSERLGSWRPAGSARH